ncbi:MAG: four helix bundle protein [Candidatus Uhrbacteria bacterium]|nr:four helix bundle protein [Candidatus Uhrbacteria bacterium]
MEIKSFRELLVWQKAMELAKRIYNITSLFPSFDQFGLANQMRRSAVSIPSNIAEGKQRKTKNDYLHFLRMAYGSAAELETQILLSKDIHSSLDYVDAEAAVIEIQKMLNVLIQHLENPHS